MKKKIFCKRCGKARLVEVGELNAGRRSTGLCFKCSRNKSGKLANNFKGGYFIRDGYKFILKPDHPNANSLGYVREHRLIMERKLNRYLSNKEVVHHINGIRNDNRPSNLRLIANQSKHAKKHPKKTRKCKICRGKHLSRGFCNKHYWIYFLKHHRSKFV